MNKGGGATGLGGLGGLGSKAVDKLGQSFDFPLLVLVSSPLLLEGFLLQSKVIIKISAKPRQTTRSKFDCPLGQSVQKGTVM